MAQIEPNVLVNSIMGKLYDVLTNGDDTVPKSENAFFSWNTPGTPIDPSELTFLTQGFTGVLKKEDVALMREAAAGGTAPAAAPVDGQKPAPDAPAPPQPAALTPDQIEALKASDAGKQHQAAENLARLLDFIPDVASSTNGQFARMAVQNDQGTLSEVYQQALQMSQVMESDLPPETVKKIQKFRDLLQTKVKKKDLITDVEVETTEPSPLQKAYFEKMAAYNDAALAYNARRIDAMSATNQRAVHDWAINADIYRNKVRAAMNDWVANGYKDDYEKIGAYIDQVMRRDMTLIKQQYVEDLEKARLTGIDSGSSFYYTSLIPGNFANSRGWTQFYFSASDSHSHSSSSFSTSQWQTKAAGGFLGLFGGTAHASGANARQDSSVKFDSANTSMEFEIAQIPIVRPWFRPAFLTSRTWRYAADNVVMKSKMLSNGKAPPKGDMPAYPTTAIFIRNLRLRMSNASGLHKFMEQHKSSAVGGGGYVSLGSFNLGASGSKRSSSGSTDSDWGFKRETDGISVPGMQLIGFKCHVMPMCPNPDPAIKSWAG